MPLVIWGYGPGLRPHLTSSHRILKGGVDQWMPQVSGLVTYTLFELLVVKCPIILVTQYESSNIVPILSPSLISHLNPPKDSCLTLSLSLSGAQFPHSLGWVLPHTLGSWLVKPGEDRGRWMRPWWRWKDRPGWRVGSREVGWGMAFSEWGGWEGNKTLLHNPLLSFLFFFFFNAF